MPKQRYIVASVNDEGSEYFLDVVIAETEDDVVSILDVIRPYATVERESIMTAERNLELAQQILSCDESEIVQHLLSVANESSGGSCLCHDETDDCAFCWAKRNSL